MWIYVDNNSRILAANPTDMAGNTGWVNTAQEVPQDLTTSEGIPRYCYKNGNISLRSGAEIAQDIQPSTITVDSRDVALAELAQMVAELSAKVGGN